MIGGRSGVSCNRAAEINRLFGVRDLLFSPNTPLETNDDESVHFFRNTGTEDEPAWQFITDTYLQDGMIDLGRGAYPSFHDFDGDGLLDLAVANKERYEGVDQTPAAVAVLAAVNPWALQNAML